MLLASAVVPFLLVRLGGHRGIHMARNLLFPGAGVVDHYPLVAAGFAIAAVVATVLWLRWGAGWLLVGIVMATTIAAGVFVPGRQHVIGKSVIAVRNAHEFPLVILLVSALAWLRSVVGRMPGLRWLIGRRHRRRQGLGDLAQLPPVDRCRAASVLALAGPVGDEVRQAVASPEVAQRARRVGVVARFRFRGDPFRRDHAAARAARLLVGESAAADVEMLETDCRRSPVGVVCSEPSWVRPLDATLVALALHRRGRTEVPAAWAGSLNGPFGVRRGHRPAWWWTPLDIGAGAALAWEHATFTALAFAAGWIDGSDWALVRSRALGAAARRTPTSDDERLVGAARVWLALVDDPEAERVVSRPGLRHDPLAVALDRLAAVLRDDVDMLVGESAGSVTGRLSAGGTEP